MVSSGVLHRVAPVRTDILEELKASFIRATRTGELRTKLALTSSVCQLLPTGSFVPSSTIFDTLMKETLIPPKYRFLQEPHSVTFQKTTFFIVSFVSN
jgi:hypothetical protein